MGWYTKEVTYNSGREATIMRAGAIVRDALALVVVLSVAGAAGCPSYHVWQQQKQGQAELARADSNRRIAVLEAQAKLDSAKLQAEAEVERAKGIAAANLIVADGLKGHEEYLRYLWIDRVAGNASKEIIYVPTEASLPILEANRSK